MNQYYSTGNDAERVSTLPVPTIATSVHKRVVYELDLGEAGMLAGEILQITAAIEVTNDLGYNVSFVTNLTLGTVTGVPGMEINEGAGENVTPSMHHGERTIARQWRVPTNMPLHRYVQLTCWAASSRGGSTARLAIMRDYGHLDVVRWAPI